jgi:hypothetical protein
MRCGDGDHKEFKWPVESRLISRPPGRGAHHSPLSNLDEVAVQLGRVRVRAYHLEPRHNVAVVLLLLATSRRGSARALLRLIIALARMPADSATRRRRRLWTAAGVPIASSGLRL